MTHELQEVKEALEFYADDKIYNYDSSVTATKFPIARIEYDSGEIAKQALIKLEAYMEKDEQPLPTPPEGEDK